MLARLALDDGHEVGAPDKGGPRPPLAHPGLHRAPAAGAQVVGEAPRREVEGPLPALANEELAPPLHARKAGHLRRHAGPLPPLPGPRIVHLHGVQLPEIMRVAPRDHDVAIRQGPAPKVGSRHQHGGHPVPPPIGQVQPGQNQAGTHQGKGRGERNAGFRVLGSCFRDGRETPKNCPLPQEAPGVAVDKGGSFLRP